MVGGDTRGKRRLQKSILTIQMQASRNILNKRILWLKSGNPRQTVFSLLPHQGTINSTTFREPTMARHTLLTQIRDLTLAIRDILPAPSVKLSEVPSKLDILPLSLESPGPESLSAEFSTNTAGPELHRLVTSLFEDKVAQLQQIYQEAFRRAVVALQECDQLDEAYHQSFRNLLARRYSLQIEEIWQSILQALSTIHWRRTVALDVSSSFQAALCDQGDAAYASKGSRGHDSNAVQILERAFCHTPNITQAEKYRLAEVTGLKPKQVTIWVSTIQFHIAFCVSAIAPELFTSTGEDDYYGQECIAVA